MVAATGPASDGQALAALGPAALERQAPGLRLHALAEPVAAGALALLWLVGAFHGERASATRRRILLHARAPPPIQLFPAISGVGSRHASGALSAASGHWYIRRRPDSFAGSSARPYAAHSEGVDDAWPDPAARPRLGLGPLRAAQRRAGFHLRDLARPASSAGDRRRHARRRGAGRDPQLGRRPLRAGPADLRGRGPRAGDERRPRRARCRHRGGRAARGRPRGRVRRAGVSPQAHVRPVRHRRLRAGC